MGIFTAAAKDKKEKERYMKLLSPTGEVNHQAFDSKATSEAQLAKPAGTNLSKPAADSDTEPPTSDSDASKHGNPNKSSGSDGDKADTSEFSKKRSVRRKKLGAHVGHTGRKRVKRSKKYRAPEQSPTNVPPEADSNPFAHKGETQLGPDMAVLAETLNLDLNTRTMLAYYDARTLEDFCLMADADLEDLVSKARSMSRALPPLQIRKVEVLREWVRDLMKPIDDSHLPAWAKQPKPTRASRNKATLIPKDWKARFKRDLPTIKESLRRRGESPPTTPPWQSFILSYRNILCGL
jgi:hypothetical protein